MRQHQHFAWYAELRFVHDPIFTSEECSESAGCWKRRAHGSNEVVGHTLVDVSNTVDSR